MHDRENGVSVRPTMDKFTGVKVFSATKAREREEIGELITNWIRDNPQVEIVDKTVLQSSDNEFHCLTLTFFFRARAS
jgi:hypothetical protein